MRRKLWDTGSIVTPEEASPVSVIFDGVSNEQCRMRIQFQDEYYDTSVFGRRIFFTPTKMEVVALPDDGSLDRDIGWFCMSHNVARRLAAKIIGLNEDLDMCSPQEIIQIKDWMRGRGMLYRKDK